MSRMQYSGAKHHSIPDENPPPAASRGKSSLTLLVESLADNTPVVEPRILREFADQMHLLADQLAVCAQESEQLPLAQKAIVEMERYRDRIEAEVRQKDRSWQDLASLLLREVLAGRSLNILSPGAAHLAGQLQGIATSHSIEDFHQQLLGFLQAHKPRHDSAQAAAGGAASDLANDNAAGLRGAGHAVAHLQRIMDKAGTGFVAEIRLNCLDMIQERFGEEAVEDCMMAVSAFITSSLQKEDAVYHWSETSLMAILQGRASEKILAAELQHISATNRDITLNVQGRTILLRVPLVFDLTAIKSLVSATDLYKIAMQKEIPV